MRNLAKIVLAVGIVVQTHGLQAAKASHPSVQEPGDVDERTLQNARFLIRTAAAHVPIVLASAPPDGATQGVEGWTTFGETGRGEQIFVYTESETFRCARTTREFQCLLKLASIIVHEAWHFMNGRDEAGAYQEQMAFLVLNGASDLQMSGVGAAGRLLVAAQRKARQARTDEKRR